MKKIEGTPAGRVFYLDLLRAIACLSVVMIHVSAEFVVRGTTGPDFLLGNLLDSLSRAGVPLFVMISGALMLDENYEFTKKKWLGHIGRMAAFYAVWSTVYCIIFRVVGLVSRGEKVRMLGVFTQIISGHYHLWFVPMIIGLYLVVPLLRLWVKEKNVRFVEYFLLLSVVFAFIVPHVMTILVHEFKALKTIQTFWDNMNLQYTAGYTAYFILGWYLNRDVRNGRLACALGIAGFLMTFAGTHIATVILEMKTYPFYENNTINVLMYSAAIFALCKSLFRQERQPGRLLQISVGWVSKYSLGIYAVHVYVITKLLPVFGQLHAAAAIPLIFALTVILSAAASMIFKKIPLVKKIV